MKLRLYIFTIIFLIVLPLPNSAMSRQGSLRKEGYSFGALVFAGMLGAATIKAIDYCFSYVAKKDKDVALKQLIKNIVWTELKETPAVPFDGREVPICSAFSELLEGLEEELNDIAQILRTSFRAISRRNQRSLARFEQAYKRQADYLKNVQNDHQKLIEDVKGIKNDIGTFKSCFYIGRIETLSTKVATLEEKIKALQKNPPL